MQPQIMATLGTSFVFIYLVCVVALIIYVLRLLGRFVGAHERVASALEIVARKMKDDGKPPDHCFSLSVLRSNGRAGVMCAFTSSPVTSLASGLCPLTSDFRLLASALCSLRI